ncbi:hypothetical protein CJF42_24835 [Pseudoalteromonas sp. NBT06-2]|uniref:hypothetical protein n=1 Tax=Pseudoalteromonas sp. NBT06-2 TaxID=2025950 RepID=UPI000BD696AB|nr:hypothetical protein [Pseudoalteromonas sp. NBT06-2]PAJ71783.1 hypothetical protein CJF42_24835 [Pseudoalteromonas sp. NBT06-2]
MFKNFIVILMVLFTVKSYSADVLNHVGIVKQVVAFPHSYGSYSVDAKGLLAIYVEGQPKGCNTGQSRVVISTDHPLHNSVLSMALLAKSTGKKVRIAYFNECTIRPESWDFAYFYLLE